MDYSGFIIPEQTISYLDANSILILSIAFVMGFVLIMRYSAKIMPAFVGIVAYIVFGFIGTQMLSILVIAIPGLSGVILSNAIIYCVYKVTVTALMLQAGRYICIKLISKEGYELGNSLMTGFGMAVGYGLIMGFNNILTSVLCTTINDMGVEALVEGMAAEEAATYIESYRYLCDQPSIYFLLTGVSSVIDMVFITAVCLITYGIFKEKLQSYMHYVVVVANIAVLMPSELMSSYDLDNYVMYIIIKLVIIFMLISGMFYVDKYYLGGEFATAGEGTVKATGHLPRFKK